MIRKYGIAFTIFGLTILFVILGIAFGGKLKVAFMSSGDIPGSTAAADTPAMAVQHLFENVQRRNLDAAYTYVANQQEEAADTFSREMAGTDSNLKSFAALNDFHVQQLSKDGPNAKVRAELQWSTPVGAFFEKRDFNVMQSKSGWKVEWPVRPVPALAPQVVPVTYERWDMPKSETEKADTTAKSAKVRIITQNVAQDADNLVVIGELVNDDASPAFVSVNATLTGEGGQVLGQENTFDEVVHNLMPGEHSPFRIDFPRVTRTQVKNIKIAVASRITSGAGTPVISVSNSSIEASGDGQKLLRGELVNQTGATVNIPQVLASYYDSSGKVIWVSDTYLDRALLPQVPIAFSMQIPADVAKNVQTYKIAVNSYSVDQS